MSDQGYDETTLSRALGVSYQTIANWLAGSKLPPSPRYPLIASVLHAEEGEVRRVVVGTRERRAGTCAPVGGAPGVRP